MNGPETSNHQKYQEAEENPVLRYLMDRLFGKINAEIDAFAPTSLLDVGCGEGHAVENLHLPAIYLGVDGNPDSIGHARGAYPDRSFQVGSLYALDIPDRSYDLVLCMEVLEHLDRPDDALRELVRVARTGLVLSVPFEPLFQLSNGLRGKYRSTWGNHPEHVQHWGWRSFPRFLAASGLLDGIAVAAAGPWLVARARPLL